MNHQEPMTSEALTKVGKSVTPPEPIPMRVVKAYRDFKALHIRYQTHCNQCVQLVHLFQLVLE